MSNRRSIPAIPSDPGLPGARGLFTGDGAQAVRGFLGERGWIVDQVAPVQVTYRPGRQCLVRYRARASNPSGESRTFSVCAETRARARPIVPPLPDHEQRFSLRDPVGEAGPYLVWAFPYDPALPGSSDGAWGPSARELLSHDGPTPAAVSVQPIRYRPRHRAVFRYRALHRGRRGRRWESWYAKVLTPAKADRARAMAETLAGHPRLAVPTPASGRAVLAFRPLGGRSLRTMLLAGGSLPAPDRVAALPAALGDWVGGAAPEWERPTPDDVVRTTTRQLRALLPDTRAELSRISDAVAVGSSQDARLEPVVHGDLYEAQVFVREDFSLGLVDLDDLGPGDPAMDAANFCAHLLALALSVPSSARRLLAYRHLVRAAFLSRLDLSPSGLAWRETLAMLLLATGPFRVLDPAWPEEVGRRVRVAVRLLEEGSAA